MRLAILIGLVGALALMGCGGELNDDGSAIARSAETVRIDYGYHCTPTDGGTSDVWLRLESTRALLARSASLQPASTGRYDSSYHPRLNKNMACYVGFTDWSSEGTTDILVERTLRSSVHNREGGALTIETRGRRYEAQRFACTRADAPTNSLTPFAIQWTGEYAGTQSVSSLELSRDGSYSAVVNGATETGTFIAGAALTYPLVYHLRKTTGYSWTATVHGYDGTLDVSRSGHHQTLNGTPQTEDACDSTQGAWTDDDVDAATGLYCLCPTDEALVWSAGGCVP